MNFLARVSGGMFGRTSSGTVFRSPPDLFFEQELQRYKAFAKEDWDSDPAKQAAVDRLVAEGRVASKEEAWSQLTEAFVSRLAIGPLVMFRAGNARPVTKMAAAKQFEEEFVSVDKPRWVRPVA